MRDHRHRARVLGRLRHRRDPRAVFERDAEALVAHPFHAAMEAVSAHPYPVRGGDQRPLPRRRPRARGPLRPADLRRRREARHAAGEARPDLRPHRARAVHRRGRRRLHARALPHRPQRRPPSAPSGSGSSTTVADDELEAASVELAAEIAANAPLSMTGNKRAIETLARFRAADARAGARADRAAPLLLCLRGLPRGHPGVRREAQARSGGGAGRSARREF